MSWLTTLRSVFNQVMVPPTPANESRIWFSGRTQAGVYIDADRAMCNATVWACLRYLQNTVGQLPWHVMSQRRVRDRLIAEQMPTHPVDWVIGTRASPEMSSQTFRETLLGDALLWGNGYAEIERDNAMRVIALHHIHPSRVEPLRNDAGTLFFRIHNQWRTPVDLDAMDIFHLRGFGSGPVGNSVVQYAAQSLGWAQATELFGASFFGEGMNPAGVVEIQKSMSPEGLLRLKQEFDKLYKGVRKSHRTAFLDAGMRWSRMSVQPNEAQFIETMQHQVEEICRWFGVPPHKVMHLLRATFCLPADALVFTASGPKPIVDVRPGDPVWSRAADGTWQLARVEKSACTGIDRILRLETTNRTLRLNARHRVLVRRAYEVPAIGRGGRNVGGRKVGVEWRTEYCAAGDLCVGETIVTLAALPGAGVRIAPNGRHLTPGFMAFCGLLIGDGNVFASGTVSIARGAKASYMDYYRAVAEREFFAGGRSMPGGEIHARAVLSAAEVADIRLALDAGEPGIKIAERYGVGATTVSAIATGRTWQPRPPRARRLIHWQEGLNQSRFRSMAAADELLALGFGGTARTKRVPDWVFGLDDDLRLAFLAGYLDADGSVDKKGRAAFHSVSRMLLEQIRHLCLSVGLPVTNLRTVPITARLPNGTLFESVVSVFTCSDPGSNRRMPTETPEYVERLAAARPFDRKDRAYPRFGGRGFTEPGCGLSRIVSITEEAAEPVYDLCVAGNHNFVADGVVVHNSNIEHQSIEVVVDSVTPWVKRFEEEADYKLFGQNRSGYFTKMNLNGLMRGDSTARAAFYKTMREMGVFSANDILMLEDLNPIGPEGDKRLVPLNMTTLDRIGEDLAAVKTMTATTDQSPAETPPVSNSESKRKANGQWLPH
jgi:HK97 family phage portal protein